MVFNATTLGTELSDARTSANYGLNAALGLLLLVCCYLLIALITYAVRVAEPPAADARRTYKKRLGIICLLNYCLTALHAILTLVKYNYTIPSTQACNATKNLIVFILVTLDATIYSFLWIRQYVVFRNTTFQSELERITLKSLQWLSMILIVGVYLASCAIIFGFRRYKFDAAKSACVSETARSTELVLSYLWTVGSVVLHSTLLLLFAYPLVKVIRFRKTSSSPNTSNMRGLVRKCFLISLVCIVTDVLVMVMAEHSSVLQGKSQLRQCIYNMNVLFNSTVLIMTFKDWRSMYFPWI